MDRFSRTEIYFYARVSKNKPNFLPGSRKFPKFSFNFPRISLEILETFDWNFRNTTISILATFVGCFFKRNHWFYVSWWVATRGLHLLFVSIFRCRLNARFGENSRRNTNFLDSLLMRGLREAWPMCVFDSHTLFWWFMDFVRHGSVELNNELLTVFSTFSISLVFPGYVIAWQHALLNKLSHLVG